MNESKPWYQSKGVLGGIASGVAGLAMVLKFVFHIDIGDLAPALSSGLLASVGLIGTVVAIYGRCVAKTTISAVSSTSTITPAVIGALLLTGVTLPGCSTTQQAKAAAFANSPAGQAVIKTATTGIIIGGMSALGQYTSTGKITGRGIATDEFTMLSNTLYGSQASVYSLMQTPKASSSSAIVSAVNTGGGDPSLTQTIAPTVAANVKAMINGGIDPTIAVQKAADALGAAPQVAAAVQSGASPQTVVSNTASAIASAPVVVSTLDATK